MTFDQNNDTSQFLSNLRVKYELPMFLRKKRHDRHQICIFPASYLSLDQMALSQRSDTPFGHI